jgi:hypothetical protein
VFVNLNIGEDRLYDRQLPGIDRFVVWIIDLGFHLFDRVGLLVPTSIESEPRGASSLLRHFARSGKHYNLAD